MKRLLYANRIKPLLYTSIEIRRMQDGLGEIHINVRFTRLVIKLNIITKNGVCAYVNCTVVLQQQPQKPYVP